MEVSASAIDSIFRRPFSRELWEFGNGRGIWERKDKNYKIALMLFAESMRRGRLGCSLGMSRPQPCLHEIRHGESVPRDTTHSLEAKRTANRMGFIHGIMMDLCSNVWKDDEKTRKCADVRVAFEIRKRCSRISMATARPEDAWSDCFWMKLI